MTKKDFRKITADTKISIVSSAIALLSAIVSISTFFSEKTNKTLQYYKLEMIIAISLALIASLLSIFIIRKREKNVTGFDETKKKKVFISYAHEDREKVLPIYQSLKEIDLNPWMDIQNLKPGDTWQKSIEDAIKSSDIFLLCFSKNSINKSGFIAKEIELALNKFGQKNPNDTLILPIKLDNSEIPKQFSMFHFADMTTKIGWEKLLITLKEKFSETNL